MSQVLFAYADVLASFTRKKLIRTFIPNIFQREGKSLESLQYVFCSDSYLLRINQEFLKHNEYTDIITFDLSDSTSVKGEIYISVERVKENALSFGTPFQQEIQRVIFHGALHLCGFKDRKKSEIAVIRYKEDEYLRLFEQWIHSQ